MNETTNSHLLSQRFSYHEPSSLPEALGLLAEFGDNAKIVAGGTDLLVQMKMERLSPAHLIALGSIPGLDGIRVTDDGLEIGARASIRTIRADPVVRDHFLALAEACIGFSSTQIQVMGTLGGNIGNASPAADSAPALLTLDARIHIEGPQGRRSVPIAEFFVGPGKSVLEPGELVTAVVLPWLPPDSRSSFRKVSRVAADIAKVSVAVMITRRGDRIADCRIALGSVAPTPRRAPSAEACLAGKRLSLELAAEAAQRAAAEMAPIDDVRSTAWYRAEIIRVLVRDMLLKTWEQTKAPTPHRPQRREATEPSATPSSAMARLAAGEQIQITMKVNHRLRVMRVFSHDLLLNVLREQLQLTGSKYGCGIGECGACTVEVDGRPALACLILAVSARNKEIVTVEGLAGSDGTLQPIQRAFIDQAAYQCGYCTPGMLMTAHSLLAEDPQPTESAIRDFLKGNLCRCTGYASIVRAVMACAQATETEPRSAAP